MLIKLIRFSICLTVFCILTACTSAMWRSYPSAESPGEELALKAARELDVIARDLDEYGSITASTAAIIKSPVDNFAFLLDQKPQELIKINTVQGRSTINQLEQLAVRMAVARSLLKEGPAASEAAAAAMSQPQGDGAGESDSTGDDDDAGNDDSTGENDSGDTAENGNPAENIPTPSSPTIPDLPDSQAPAGITGNFTPPGDLLGGDELARIIHKKGRHSFNQLICGVSPKTLRRS